MLNIVDIENFAQIYDYQMRFHSPYFFPLPFAAWRESFVNDIDPVGSLRPAGLQK